MRVVATARGYDNVTIREVGDEFDMPDGACDPVPLRDEHGKAIPGKFEPAPWFKPVPKRDKGSGNAPGGDLA